MQLEALPADIAHVANPFFAAISNDMSASIQRSNCFVCQLPISRFHANPNSLIALTFWNLRIFAYVSVSSPTLPSGKNYHCGSGAKPAKNGVEGVSSVFLSLTRRTSSPLASDFR